MKLKQYLDSTLTEASGRENAFKKLASFDWTDERVKIEILRELTGKLSISDITRLNITIEDELAGTKNDAALTTPDAVKRWLRKHGCNPKHILSIKPGANGIYTVELAQTALDVDIDLHGGSLPVRFEGELTKRTFTALIKNAKDLVGLPDGMNSLRLEHVDSFAGMPSDIAFLSMAGGVDPIKLVKSLKTVYQVQVHKVDKGVSCLPLLQGQYEELNFITGEPRFNNIMRSAWKRVKAHEPVHAVMLDAQHEAIDAGYQDYV